MVPARRTARPSVGAYLLAMGCFILVGEASELMATQAADISAFWPPAGVGMALAIWFGWRMLPAIWIAAFAGNLVDVSGMTGLAFAAVESGWFWTALIDASLAVVSALLGWCALAQFGATPYPFSRVLHAGVFVLGSAGLASALTALLGCLLLVASGDITWAAFGLTWATWATGDAVGILVVVPIILTLTHSAADHGRRPAAWLLELAGVLVAIGLVAIPVAYDLPLEYLAILPLIWASFRLGQRGAAIAVGIVAVVSVLVDVNELGYFSRFDPAVSLLLVQTFVGSVAIIPLTLVPTIVERQRAAIHQAKLERDLALAQTIQQGLLPSAPPSCRHFDIAGWSRPADETGGDYYDWVDVRSSEVVLTLGDVTGHGVGPALVAAASRAYIRAMAGEHDDVGALLTRVNGLLVNDLPDNRFITLAAITVDDAHGAVRLRSAGQGPICLFRAARGDVEVLAADDPPLGIVDGYAFGASTRITLEPDDVLVLMTDGFIEWANHEGELYGIDRFTMTLTQAATKSAAEIIDVLARDVRAYATGVRQPDDLTAVVIKRRDAGAVLE